MPTGHNPSQHVQYDPRAYAIEWNETLRSDNTFTPVQDSLGGTSTQQQRFTAGAGLFIGVVVDAIASMHAYRVLLEQDKPPLVCLSTGATPFLPVGVRDCGGLLPGAMVVVMQHPQLLYGLIISVIPPLESDAADCRSDMIHQSSYCGLHVDKVHSKTLELAGVLNANAGRPLDGLNVGEAGWISETGIRVWLDSFMAQIAVDEHCGLFAFYHDQLLRLAGHNLQVLSAGHSDEIWNDRNELVLVKGNALYPWEQLGALNLSTPPFVKNTPSAIQNSKAYYSLYEPAHDDQLPFHRYREFNGYMGQGHKIFLSGLPQDDLFRMSTAKDMQIPGLFEQQLLPTGEFGIRSAAGITIAKRPNIPTPRQIQALANPEADSEEDYKFSGASGQGADHKVTAAPIVDNGKISRAAQGPATILDLHAHLFNWKGSHQFHYHKKTWELPEESESETVTSNATPIQFSNLQGQQYLDPPAGINIPIDHRYGEATVYPNYSYISLLNEGGIVIGDGYGAEIRMSGGSITLSAPGDVWLQPGRNVQLWGGNDVIVRAKDSIDLSASTKDVRIKAEKNMQILANDGGVLVEGNGSQIYDFTEDGEAAVSGGVMLKAKKGNVTSWSHGVYMRTGGGEIAGGGDIVLDSNKGQTSVIINASNVLQYVTNTSTIYFSNAGEVTGTTLFGANGTVIGNSMYLMGSMVAQGPIVNRGGMSTVGGSMAYEISVGQLKDENLLKAIEILDDANTETAGLQQSGTGIFGELFTDFLYTDKQPGNDDTIDNATFKFRTAEQYGTTAFALMESRWQQLARLGEQTLAYWEEKAVSDTYPFPGRTAMVDTDTLFQQDLSLFDAATGNSKDRESTQEQYESPQIQAPTPVTLGTRYLVVGP